MKVIELVGDTTAEHLQAVTGVALDFSALAPASKGNLPAARKVDEVMLELQR